MPVPTPAPPTSLLAARLALFQQYDDIRPNGPVAVPILRETTVQRGAPSPSPGSTDVYVSNGAAVAGGGRAKGGEDAAAGKKTLLPEPLVRALAHGVVNGILLPPVAVR